MGSTAQAVEWLILAIKRRVYGHRIEISPNEVMKENNS